MPNKSIPKKFYRGDNRCTARTVGEIKDLLAELPDDLPVQAPFGEPVQLIVYNHGRPDMHLEVVEADEE
jgi:hypothetical protein